MKKKVVWGVVSGWMVAALLLSSCAPAVVEEGAPKEVVVPKEVVTEEGREMVKWTGTKRDGTVVEKMIEKPKYGGVFIDASELKVSTWNHSLTHEYRSWPLHVVNEELMTRDWTRGPGGTEEWASQVSGHASLALDNIAGVLAESWELPDPETVHIRIRQGVHWVLTDSEASQLVGGRELTAEDVVASVRREWTIGWHKNVFPFLADMDNVENSVYVSPDDPWTVVVKTKPKKGWLIHERLNAQHIYAKEVLEKYGDKNDWRYVVGTGPFILKDYVGDSSLTYDRNPDFWMTDPFFPENKLPYPDSLKILIIPDFSTRMAALRAGQIDRVYDLTSDDAKTMFKTNPELESMRYLKGDLPYVAKMRTDKTELPFSDVRVRRALLMATDRRALVNDYFDGDAELFSAIVPPITGYMHLYIPLEDLPESVQELYQYNPDKAKQLLAEAGYPDGFKTSIIVWKNAEIDIWSIVKDYWAKVGIELEIDVKEYGSYVKIAGDRTHPEMINQNLPRAFNQEFQSGFITDDWPFTGRRNLSYINDPYMDQLKEEVSNEMAENAKGATFPRHRESMIYRLNQAWYVELPEPYVYGFWQPWLKGYYGSLLTGGHSLRGFMYYTWIDQELKESMGR